MNRLISIFLHKGRPEVCGEVKELSRSFQNGYNVTTFFISFDTNIVKRMKSL